MPVRWIRRQVPVEYITALRPKYAEQERSEGQRGPSKVTAPPKRTLFECIRSRNPRLCQEYTAIVEKTALSAVMVQGHRDHIYGRGREDGLPSTCGEGAVGSPSKLPGSGRAISARAFLCCPSFGQDPALDVGPARPRRCLVKVTFTLPILSGTLWFSW